MTSEIKSIHGENKRAHLAMIQCVINRMGGNLFFLKGWAVMEKYEKEIERLTRQLNEIKTKLDSKKVEL